MTPKLQCVDGKSRGTELALQGKAIFEIGSAPTADLRLDDGEVAASHMKVYVSSGDFAVFDVSGNGFLHNGKRALKVSLKDGDTLQVGTHQLRLATQDTPQVHPGSAAATVGAGGRFELQAVKGNDAGRTYDLRTKAMFILGRGVATDITVWDIRCSRVHCRIDRDAEGYLITDLNASNGTYVNGQKIESHRLVSGDEIKIGSTVLQYVQA
jgi:pSer/pThr/pTyr-binding forkhead associated (FHA) protein